jgi:hypothetical protein
MARRARRNVTTARAVFGVSYDARRCSRFAHARERDPLALPISQIPGSGSRASAVVLARRRSAAM